MLDCGKVAASCLATRWKFAEEKAPDEMQPSMWELKVCQFQTDHLPRCDYGILLVGKMKRLVFVCLFVCCFFLGCVVTRDTRHITLSQEHLSPWDVTILRHAHLHQVGVVSSKRKSRKVPVKVCLQLVLYPFIPLYTVHCCLISLCLSDPNNRLFMLGQKGWFWFSFLISSWHPQKSWCNRFLLIGLGFYCSSELILCHYVRLRSNRVLEVLPVNDIWKALTMIPSRQAHVDVMLSRKLR